jgi:hypothetical protein
MKKFYLSRTVWIGVLQIVSAILMLVADFIGRGDFSPVAYVVLVNGIVMIALRFLTNESITFK